jgi:hypothetical protein
VAGFGMGCVFPPMTTTAMRDVDPKLAGAASGMLNTVRQVGSVIGTAAVGALLQNRLAGSLTTEATRRSVALPQDVRHAFVGAFKDAASFTSGTSSGFSAPKGTPAALAAELSRLGSEVFSIGYVQAMRWTMILPISVIGLAALSCLAIRNRRQSPVASRRSTAPVSSLPRSVHRPARPRIAPLTLARRESGREHRLQVVAVRDQGAELGGRLGTTQEDQPRALRRSVQRTRSPVLRIVLIRITLLTFHTGEAPCRSRIV